MQVTKVSKDARIYQVTDAPAIIESLLNDGIDCMGTVLRNDHKIEAIAVRINRMPQTEPYNPGNPSLAGGKDPESLAFIRAENFVKGRGVVALNAQAERDDHEAYERQT